MVCGTGLGIPDTQRVPDGYGDGTISSNPSGIGYRYGDMLRSRGKGLGRQYPYPTRPIAMSSGTESQIHH